jgi:hypothetical protein
MMRCDTQGLWNLVVAVVRQLWNFIVSIGLTCAGLYVLYEELFVSYSGIHGRYRPA